MVVAVIAVRMVQVAFDEVVHMIAVRDRLVPTAGAMLMAGLVATAVMIGRAALRVVRTDFQDMFFNEV